MRVCQKHLSKKSLLCTYVLIAGVCLLSACGGSGGNSTSNSSSTRVSSSVISSASSEFSSTSSTSSSSSGAIPTRVDSGLVERVNNHTCIAPDTPSAALGSYAFQSVAVPTGIDSPIFLAQAPGNNDRYYVLERPGRVKTFIFGDSAVTQTVDFSEQVITSGEGGALGMAFHPDFPTNRFVYIFLTATRQSYGITDSSVSMVSVVRRYTVSSDGLSFSDPLDILAPNDENDTRLNHQHTNHKGGWIGFSPTDGYLYIATGDKGEWPGNVPIQNNFSNPAQDLQSLHGKMLRIDVDGDAPYSIPASNPFANGGGAAEIFAWGFRNPWRASFDRETGDLWVGDVGEGSREEINIVETGGDYGWPFREGHLDRCNGCVNGQQSAAPVVDLPRANGWIAVIGGYVYRGSAIPELQGRYIFADFIRSGFSTISYAGNEPFVEDLITGGGGSQTLSEDNAGNIWQVHSWGGFNRLTQISAPPAAEFPQTLSATGCFDDNNIRQPVAGVVPYDVNSPLWSDGATKERFFALPDNTHIEIEDDGLWAFPIGSVLIKTFLLDDIPVETRLLIRQQDGDWGGYSYEWNDTGTDAQLLASGKTKTVGDQIWRYPSRAQCMSCHTAPNGNYAAERVLGLETAQINRDFIYPGNLIANQIQTLASVGYFDTDPGPHAGLVTMPNPLDGNANTTDRARAYLHPNCANCHQPNGPTSGNMDFRFSTDWADSGYCNVAPSHGDFDIADARLLKPGAAQDSIIPLRMQRTDAHRMPPLGVDIVDAQGVSVINEWINSLQECP